MSVFSKEELKEMLSESAEVNRVEKFIKGKYGDVKINHDKTYSTHAGGSFVHPKNGKTVKFSYEVDNIAYHDGPEKNLPVRFSEPEPEEKANKKSIMNNSEEISGDLIDEATAPKAPGKRGGQIPSFVNKNINNLGYKGVDNIKPKPNLDKVHQDAQKEVGFKNNKPPIHTMGIKYSGRPSRGKMGLESHAVADETTLTPIAEKLKKAAERGRARGARKADKFNTEPSKAIDDGVDKVVKVKED